MCRCVSMNHTPLNQNPVQTGRFLGDGPLLSTEMALLYIGIRYKPDTCFTSDMSDLSGHTCASLPPHGANHLTHFHSIARFAVSSKDTSDEPSTFLTNLLLWHCAHEITPQDVHSPPEDSLACLTIATEQMQLHTLASRLHCGRIRTDAYLQV